MTVNNQLFARARDYLLGQGYGQRMRILDVVASAQLAIAADVNTEVTLSFALTDQRLSYAGPLDSGGRLGANQCSVLMGIGYIGDTLQTTATPANQEALGRQLAAQRANIYTQGNLAVARKVGTALCVPGAFVGNDGAAVPAQIMYVGRRQNIIIHPLEGLLPLRRNELLRPTIVQRTSTNWVTGTAPWFTTVIRMLVADEGVA